MLISQSYVKRCFVNFLVIFGDVWKGIVFLKGLGPIRTSGPIFVTFGRFHHLCVTCYRKQVRIRFPRPRTCPTIQENKEAVVL